MRRPIHDRDASFESGLLLADEGHSNSCSYKGRVERETSLGTGR
jgi:hypothetical protein